MQQYMLTTCHLFIVIAKLNVDIQTCYLLLQEAIYTLILHMFDVEYYVFVFLCKGNCFTLDI